MHNQSVYRVMTIAGSDSGGGAGIEADLKTFAALGAYGMAALTSVTAQNTVTVAGVHDIPPEFVARQIDVVADDIGIDAAKTGMLSSAEIVEAVSASLARNSISLLVVDPVMVAKSGDHLLRESARRAVRDHLLPLAHIVTPNVPEAEVLSAIRITDQTSMQEAARRIHDFGPVHVLMKGGHMEQTQATDYLFDGRIFHEFSAPRIDTKNTHGTGCTFSSAITAFLARGFAVEDAVAMAKAYLTQAIRRGFSIGAGHGPLNHMWPMEDPEAMAAILRTRGGLPPC